MGREIGKFRGKRVDNGEWVYGYYVKAENIHYIATEKPLPEDGEHEMEVVGFVEVDPETVGQFTGLLDWYVGDIIKKGEIIRAITVDDEHGLRFMLGKHQLCKQDALNGTKIGNLHENADLIQNISAAK